MRVLLADDDQALRRVVQFKLEKRGYEVTTVEDGRQALNLLKEDKWDLLLSDIKMPDVNGIELLEQARVLRPELKVILITAYATVSQAVQAVKLGAFDYITKPFDDEDLFASIEKADAFRKLEQENELLKGRLRQGERMPRLYGVSAPFKSMMEIVGKIAATDATVLLAGPSGTGKELVARHIHTSSERAGREFVAVNCAAIPRELLESELFGHVKGAFTGAVRDKKGKFEVADGGTVFLDEIGELAPELQAKLLRVLQEREVEPVGSEKTKKIDVRIIGATNAELQRKIAAGEFREDLFYRLNVIPIRIPSLSERSDDIPILVKEFVNRFAPGEQITVNQRLMSRLQGHGWPGNIRELENLVERMVILREGNELTEDDLPDDFGRTAEGEPLPADTDAPPGRLTFHEAEEKMIREALESNGWNRTRAARSLSIPRHVLLYRMKKYSIRPD